MFIDFGPTKSLRLTRYEGLVILGLRKVDVTPFAMTADDDLFNGGYFVEQRFKQRQEVFVGKDHPILCVVDDVFKISRPQANV